MDAAVSAGALAVSLCGYPCRGRADRHAIRRFRDSEGLERDCRRARRDGFTGRIAIHPDQVKTINHCFSPSEEEVLEARKIVAAFAARPEAGALGIDGKMYDIPHLKAARRTLASVD